MPDPDWARWEVRLVHAEAGCRIVRVSAHDGQGRCLGSTLGEGATAEAAEQRGIERLRLRLEQRPQGTPAAAEPATPAGLPSAPVAAPTTTPPPAPAAPPPAAPSPEAPPEPAEPAEEPPPDPEDWSEELAAIEAECRRLGWDRSQEGTFLQRCFGHASRSRITTYSDLLAYLAALRPLPPGADPATAAVPLRRPDLMRQCNELLSQLSWGAQRGRQALEQRFGVASRSQLSDDQLLAFNIALEEELLAGAGESLA